MKEDQIKYYEDKLKYEMDPSDLFDAINTYQAIVVVDARKDFAYQKERIPGAINLPHREMNEETVNHLDRSKTYVCYCDGIGCNASTKGALNMTKLGFKTKELIGGLEWWKIDGYATEGTDAMKGLEITCAC
jgi:rhodanese-related sulfurtransferase